MSSILFGHHLPVEQSWLSEIAIWVGWLVPSDQTSNSVLARLNIRSHCEWPERVGLIVWLASLVSINSHRAVSLAVGNLCSVGAVDWDLKRNIFYREMLYLFKISA